MTKLSDDLSSTNIGAAGDVFLFGFVLSTIGGIALVVCSLIGG